MPPTPPPIPVDIDVRKDRGLTIRWNDGRTSFYPVAHLRRMSPSADMRSLRKEMSRNPLTVLPAGGGASAVTITGAELRGNYALWIAFSDGHATGIYSWEYLRSIDPDAPPENLPGEAADVGSG